MHDGKRMGVYVSWKNKNEWTFDIHGHIIDEVGLMPMSNTMKNAYFGDFGSSGGYKQKELLTKSPLC